MTVDEIDAVLACEQRILRIGSPRARSYLCYPRPIKERELTKHGLLDLLKADLGLATLEAAATYAMDTFGVVTSVGRMREAADHKACE